MSWEDYNKHVEISDLVGKTLTKVINSGDLVYFHCEDGTEYQMLHFQDCCENVMVEDVVGDLDDLIGTPILDAREDSNSGEGEDCYDSHTWTFYNFRTIKGSVTIRWHGSSNGYYSESVSFIKV